VARVEEGLLGGLNIFAASCIYWLEPVDGRCDTAIACSASLPDRSVPTRTAAVTRLTIQAVDGLQPLSVDCRFVTTRSTRARDT